MRGRRDLARHRLLGQLVGQIGRGGHAGAERAVREPPQGAGIPHVEKPALAGRAVRDGLQCRPEELAGRISVCVRDKTLHVRVAGDAGPAQHLGVHVHDVPALVHHHHRTGRRHPVEVGGHHAPPVEEDGVEAPAHRRPIRVGNPGFRRAEPLHDVVDALEPLVDDTVRRGPIEEAEIGVFPRRAFPGVAVPLDESRHDDLVGEAVIELVVAPSREFLERAGAEHAAVAHRDVGRLGAAGVHGEDLARAVDGRRHRGFSRREVGVPGGGAIADLRPSISVRIPPRCRLGGRLWTRGADCHAAADRLCRSPVGSSRGDDPLPLEQRHRRRRGGEDRACRLRGRESGGTRHPPGAGRDYPHQVRIGDGAALAARVICAHREPGALLRGGAASR